MDIAFTDNYKNLSNERGYQFKFFCERCGNGYISSFQPSTTGFLSSILKIAGNFFGGEVNKFARTSDDVHRMASGRQHDKALKKAVKEVRGGFNQCRRCGEWVCEEVCWNEERGLCKGCAPELGEEMAAAQAQHATQEAHAHARMSEKEKHLKKEDWKEQKKALCPECGASVKAHADFCGECGAKLAQAVECPKCGEKISPNQSFCEKCGQKIDS